MATMRESSKKEWTSNRTIEDINGGSLQRIADACELMAKDHATLVAERGMYKQWYQSACARLETERRRNAALRGHIKRLKAQIAEAKEVRDATQ